jgi:hypothetical protein
MDGTLLIAYAIVGLIVGFMCNMVLLRGNVRASNMAHFQIGLMSCVVAVAWPVALLGFASFTAAKWIWILSSR